MAAGLNGASAATKAARILVVDDDIPVLDTLEEYLSGCGYEVVGTGTALLGESLLAESAVDLAILDVGVHGLRLARRAAGRGIPVILISGHPAIIEMGEFGEVLRKPFRLAQLGRRIEDCLGAESRDGRAAAADQVRHTGLAS